MTTQSFKTPGGDEAESTLALFDFDGTLTTRDTLIEFVKFYRGNRKYRMGMLVLAPVMALYVLRLIPNWKAKEYFLTQYFGDEPIESFNTRGEEFARTVVPKLIRPDALAAIEGYRNGNATIVVVSASAENWVKPWCDQQGITCLATRLEVHRGALTGKIYGQNCHGEEKVRRIKEKFVLSDFKHIVAYGDSSGDTAMLALATKRHYKPFR